MPILDIIIDLKIIIWDYYKYIKEKNEGGATLKFISNDSEKPCGELVNILIDPETGVNYLKTFGNGAGICPRYLPDGTLYVTPLDERQKIMQKINAERRSYGLPDEF